MEADEALICEAIHARRRLVFNYDARVRVVEPYCHGSNVAGSELLRAVQVGGTSGSGAFGFGKLWIVAKMSQVRLSDETFIPGDPAYNPNDRAMAQIHCRV